MVMLCLILAGANEARSDEFLWAHYSVCRGGISVKRTDLAVYVVYNISCLLIILSFAQHTDSRENFVTKCQP